MADYLAYSKGNTMKTIFLKRVNLSSLLAALSVLGALSLQPAYSQLPDFTKLIEDNDQMVVNINTSRTVKNEGRQGHMPQMPEEMPPQFQDLFKHFFEDLAPSTGEYNTKSLGSGVIISEDGYIITNNHVIQDADEIQVRLIDGRNLIAKLIGSDPHSDLALLKIDAKGLPIAKLGSSEDLKVGEWVVAIGSPFGFEHSATAGIVSAKGRGLHTEQYVPFIQTDAAINPGNSGGPLLNMKGEVVGINSQIVSNGGGGYIGLSFAVPAEVAKTVVEQIKTKGYVTRGWLGVSLQPVDAGLAESFGLSRNEGALIADVVENSPASEAKMKPGDVILAINGKKVASAADVPPIVGNVTPNTVVIVNIIRDKTPMSLKVKITELPREEEEKQVTEKTQKIKNRIGIQVRDFRKEEREQMQLEEGGVLITSVAPDSPAAKAGLRGGDILFRVGQTPLNSTAKFAEIVKNMDKNVKVVPVLVARRNEGRRYLAIRLD